MEVGRKKESLVVIVWAKDHNLGMARNWDTFMAELEAADRAEGPEAVAESRILRAHYELANSVYQARKKRGMSQQQLAAASGIDQAEISRIERGDSNPTIATMSRVLAAVGLKLSYPTAPIERRTGSKRVALARSQRTEPPRR